MRLAPRIATFTLLLCAAVSAHAAPGDPIPVGIPPMLPVRSDSATDLSKPYDLAGAARLGVSVGAPAGRYAHSAIIDPAGNRMIMYGGFGQTTYADLWELALAGTAGWSPVPAGATPAPVRGGHVALLDTLRHRMLVFGGYDGSPRNETWAYSLAPEGGWSQLAVSGVPPSPRYLHSAIHDPVRDRLIVFGGYQDYGYLNDVWALSLSGTPTWSLLTVDGTPPSPRRACSVIYDPIRDRMIVFGGTNASPNREVWALNLGGTPSWSLLASGDTGPTGRTAHSAVYDPARDVMWIFAGLGGSLFNDLWMFSLSGTPTWRQHYPSGTVPGARMYHSAVLDAPNDRMVVFAGYNGPWLNDTWFLRLAGNPTWYPLGSEPPAPATSPEPRFDQAPIVSPTTIELGQSFTISVSVSNRGVVSDDGIISMSFPSLTDPADHQWVESSASGDTPGYSELPAGSPMVTLDCQPMTAGALAVEYRDDAWEAFGAETNAFAVTVRPKAAGTFYIDVRSTMRKPGTACEYVNAFPSGAGGQAIDQQGWAVRRLAVTVVDSPIPIASVAVSPTFIELGQTFTINASVANSGSTSDDGRIAISFQSMTDPADAQWASSTSSGDAPGYLEHPAGSAVTNASCQPITASYLVVEYADGDWRGFPAESNTMSVTVRPKAAGTFYFDIRSTMRKSGTACEYVNAIPWNSGDPVIDQQGWTARRFAVIVVDVPAPAFTSVGYNSASIVIGQTFTLGATVTNAGTTSDDGRIAIGFPGLADPADAQWVSIAYPPGAGYIEHPAGSALTDASCQPITASYLVVEYADSDWRGPYAESHQLSLIVRPKATGTFYFDIRSTMHRPGTGCEFVNAVPSGGANAVDQQGWAVKRFAVTVRDEPLPIYDGGIVMSATSIDLGQTFTIGATVTNAGGNSDDGRIAISFPGMTDPADAQWVGSTSIGDVPGYLEHPAGSALTNASCQPLTASYLMVEYADGDWTGLGAETNTLGLTVQPKAAGTFYFYVRVTMRKPGASCGFVNVLPPPGAETFVDQQGWSVRRFAVTVLDTPDPVFTTGVALSATTIGLGQSFTVTTTVRNDGAGSPDGRIAVSFPGLTDPGDVQWVSSPSAGDSPGYAEHPAGSSLSDASCQAVPAIYFLAEYADGDWSRLGAESNTFSVRVRPQAMGTFYVYIRATMRKIGPDPCVYVNDLPPDGQSGFIDQQGFPVRRFEVTVGPAPPPPAPVFIGFPSLPPLNGQNVITLGQSIDLYISVRNSGGATDDGRVVLSFHSPCVVSMPGPDHPPGSTLLDANCQPVVTTRAVSEFVDDLWAADETHSFWVAITPQTAGTFVFDLRSTMLVAGSDCEYVTGIPSGQTGIDEQGWAVRRVTFTVRPNTPVPVFTAPITGIPASIAFGESFTFTAVLGNVGTTSPDGRLVVGFPQFTDAGDAIWVSNGTSGDLPGYREQPAGSLLLTTTCQSVTAPHLVVEYADQSWGGYDTFGAEINEQNAVVVTVTPQSIGDFFIHIRGTMRQNFASCGWQNVVPAQGEAGYTDPQGWPVARFRVQVTAPLTAYPDPVFTEPVEVSATTIIQGESFTLRARVRNDGSDSDQGIVTVSFPSLTSGGDGQWVAPVIAGNDVPGYQELPAGSVIPDASCYYDPAAYMAVEYADDAWKGILNGHERNELYISVRPPATGTFYVYVRSAMRETGSACSYRTALPSNGEAGFVDQQGWAVKRFAVTVVAVPPPLVGPVPLFLGEPSGVPTYVALGQSLTLSMSVRNDGLASDDGRISVSFPTLTAPTDGQWVTSVSSGDTPGYREHPAGSPLPDVNCQAGAASYLAVEYTDDNWLGIGAEYNSLLLTVVPQTVGTFSIDIRCTMHRSGGPPCDEAGAIPTGGVGTFTDQQGRQVRRFQVNVFTIPAPGAPSTTWSLITPPPGGPAARHGASFAYDEPRDELFLYGGAGVRYFSDIWSLPLAPGSAWKETVPGGSPPLRRIMHSMIHNPVEGHFVFFGGYYNNLMDDLALLALRPVPWWFQFAAQAPSPSPRIGHTATYDPVRHRMLLIGGYDGTLHNDVWAYALPGNGAWTRLEPLGTPMPIRAQHAAVYDPVRDRVIVFGGDGATFLNDVWELKLGVTPEWNRITPTDLPPSGRREHTMVYDNARDRMVVFGGFDGARRNDLWALTLADPPRWEQLFSATTAPSPRTMHGAIYDRFRRRMVMFGGQMGSNSYSNELWELTDNVPTPALASLVSTECLPDRVRLAWAIAGAAPIRAEVHRSTGESEGWTMFGSPEARGDRLVFEDRDVTPGSRLGYRLVELEESGETVLNEVWVTVPVRVGLSLAGASPNPAEGELRVAFSLPAGGAATLELFDLKGRLLARRDVGAMGAGEHRVLLHDGRHIGAGVYLVRLVRGDRVLTAKAAVIR